ncbi:MAG: PSD1 and planctomycete cytochrome C domain-containing protein [Planctomycetaceae bacterium]
MQLRIRDGVVSLFVASGVGMAAAAAASEAEDLFETVVRPLVADRCVGCHGATTQWASLRLDSAAAALAGGDSGPAVVPGEPEASHLLTRVASGDPEVRMPPPEEGPGLTAEQVAALRHWIAAGAPWPADAAAAPPSPEEVARSHWAFQPVRRPEPPAVADASWTQSPIDRFVLARLEAAGLEPSPEADRATLIRRATYDLTGLPPTAAEISSFVEDPSPDAYASLIERLLASPRYGEQWARHWLDVARYSDTKGYVDVGEGNRFVHSAPYRDWVIRAFQEDMPYDRFVRLQLAADQLAGDDRRDLAAMGLLTLGRRFLGNTPDIVDDRIDVTCRGLLGLTVGCARCHDHKYDPISTREYYGLYGVFQNCVERLEPLPPAPASPAPPPEFTSERERRQRALDELTAKHRVLGNARLRRRLADYLLAQRSLEKYPEQSFVQLSTPDDLLPGLVRRWEVLLTRAALLGDPVFAAWTAYAALPDAEFAARAAEIAPRLAAGPPAWNPRVAAAFRAPPASIADVAARYADLLAVVEVRWEAACAEARCGGGPEPTALPDPDDEQLRQAFFGPSSPCVIPDEPLPQTDYLWDYPARQALWKAHQEVEACLVSVTQAAPCAVVLVDRPTIVEPQVFRRGNPADKGEVVPRQWLRLLAGDEGRRFAQGSGRRELAEAITNPGNPLTPRVWANRVWLHHFGVGLVDSPSDFGLRSPAPSHPEVLDWLAAFLVDGGWSTKAVHRAIMRSATYRQASSGPSGTALVRALDVDPGNRLLWRMHPRRLSFEQFRDALLAVSGDLDEARGGPGTDLFGRRRSIYVTIDRQYLPAVMTAFDVANPNLHAPQRVETTTAIQALFGLNHPFVAGRAARVAEQVSTADAPARVVDLYRRVLGRSPSPDEHMRADQFLADAAGEAGSGQFAPLAQVAQVLLLSNEFMFVD